MKDLDNTIDNLASELLEYLSQILPPVSDNGELGELVLLRALEAYRLMAEQP